MSRFDRTSPAPRHGRPKPFWKAADARLRRVVLHMYRARSGNSAVEFAFIAPLMLLMWGGTIILVQALLTQQRTRHMTSAVGDLVAQQSALNAGYVTNAFAAATLIMSPIPATISQRVSSVVVQSNKQVQVAWSCATGLSMTAFAQNAIVAPPTGVVNTSNPGDSAIYSQSSVKVTFPINIPYVPSTFTMTSDYWLKPRYGSAIALTSC